MQLGPAEVKCVSDGMFKLDGGAMFGVVPQAVWAKKSAPDELGRIRLALRCLLVRVDDRTILVDTGIGDKFDERSAERFGIDHTNSDLLRSLEAEGVAREDVTDVVLTHLHFDHTGGTTIRDANGKLELTFPKARHFVQRRNFVHGRRPTARDRGSYLGENFEMLARSDLLVLLDGPTEIAAGIDTLIFEGHTVGQQLVRVRDPSHPSNWLLYAADIIPTSAHLPSAFVMGYDLLPDVTAREKERIVHAAAEEGGLLVFEHDPDRAACSVRMDDRGRPQVHDPKIQL